MVEGVAKDEVALPAQRRDDGGVGREPHAHYARRFFAYEACGGLLDLTQGGTVTHLGAGCSRGDGVVRAVASQRRCTVQGLRV